MDFFWEGIEEYVVDGLSYGARLEENGEFVACRVGKFLTRDAANPYSDMKSFSDPKVRISCFQTCKHKLLFYNYYFYNIEFCKSKA